MRASLGLHSRCRVISRRLGVRARRIAFYVQDYPEWMGQRNCELRNAIEFRDPVIVAEIGCLVGQGVSMRVPN